MGTGGNVPLILIFGNMEERSSLSHDRFTPHPGKTAPVNLKVSSWFRAGLVSLEKRKPTVPAELSSDSFTVHLLA
jgi:hypothetical protein